MGVAVGGDRRGVEDSQGLHHQAPRLIELSLRSKFFGVIVGNS